MAKKENVISRVKSKWEHFSNKIHLTEFMNFVDRAQVGMVAPTVAYYTIVALVPLIMSIGVILGVIGLDTTDINNFIRQQMPNAIGETLIPIVNSVLHGSVSVLSVSVLVVMWTASGILSTFRKIFNDIYDLEETENGLVTRIVSFLWFLAFLLAAVVIGLFSSLFPVIMKNLPHIEGWLQTLASQTWIYALLLAWVILIIFNYTLPAVKIRWQSVAMGSGMAAIALSILNAGFGLYAQFAMRNVDFYRSLGSLLALLIYFNLVATIIVLGQVFIAWINTFYKEETAE